MKDPASWRPSKFESARGGLRASRNPGEVLATSRMVVDMMAHTYETMLRDHARGRLLDLGCGKVPLYGVYRDLVEDCFCVDWDSTSHPSRHVDLTTDLNRGLPLPDGAFDTVLATDVFEHIATPRTLWADAARVLAPGGKLLVGVPFLYWIHEQPHDYFRYTEFALRRFCDQAGLEIVALDPYAGAAEVVADIVAKHLAFSTAMASAFQIAAAGLLRLWPVRHLTRRSSRTFPLGYALVAVKPGLTPDRDPA
ncbi:MAG: methyltransferase domain-containing protein [Anaerolineae bacterium]